MLADAVNRALSQSAHSVDIAHDGGQADRALSSSDYDLAILDVGLPVFDGFEVLRRLRSRRSSVPVLVLSVRDTVEDRVHGLDLGADDYLTKPFHLFELEARVRALIRRAHSRAVSDIVQGVDPQGAAIGHQVDAWPDSGRGEPPQPTPEPGGQQLRRTRRQLRHRQIRKGRLESRGRRPTEP